MLDRALYAALGSGELLCYWHGCPIAGAKAWKEWPFGGRLGFPDPRRLRCQG